MIYDQRVDNAIGGYEEAAHFADPSKKVRPSGRVAVVAMCERILRDEPQSDFVQRVYPDIYAVIQQNLKAACSNVFSENAYQITSHTLQNEKSKPSH